MVCTENHTRKGILVEGIKLSGTIISICLHRGSLSPYVAISAVSIFPPVMGNVIYVYIFILKKEAYNTPIPLIAYHLLHVTS